MHIMTKRFIVATLLLLLLPALLIAGNPRLKALIERHSTRPGVESKEFAGGSLWAMRTMAPKGAMKGVEKLTMLIFEDGTSGSAYTAFRTEVEPLLTDIGMQCVENEKKDSGEVRVYADSTKSRLNEFMMLMELEKITMIMHLEGDIENKKR